MENRTCLKCIHNCTCHYYKKIYQIEPIFFFKNDVNLYYNGMYKLFGENCQYYEEEKSFDKDKTNPTA